jgi:D-methionine transport system ATP-binding protein
MNSERKICIQAKALRKSLQSNEILKGIDLTIEKGEIYGIIGMSGAGKSTLLRCLTCLDPPTSGSIEINGQEWTRLNQKELRLARRKIGLIFQHFHLFSAKNVLLNVVFPLGIAKVPRERWLKHADKVLSLVDMRHKALHYPANLSGGEKQRVAIARALVAQPEILFCDEITSSLDPQSTQSILNLLAQINRELHVTIVLISHEMDVIKKICDRVAVLEEGRIVEEGRVAHLFANAQHETTRHFLQKLTHTLPSSLALNAHPSLYRLSFTAGSAQKPLISQMLRSYQVEVNILLGGIDVLKEQTVGKLVIELTGAEEERQKALAFLKTQDVLCEELK